MRGLTTVVFAVLAAFAFGGMQSEECTHWNDEEANVAFPERLGDMKLCRRDVYGEDDYSLLYNSRGILDGVGGRYKLTVYLFRRRGVELESDGLPPEVIKEVRDATAAIEVKVGGGEYSSVRQVIPGKRIVMPATGVDAMYSVSSARGVNGSKYDFCAVLVFAYKGRFIKLRYTEAVDRAGVEDTPNWQACIAKLDELIKRGADDHAVDVYAIKDDAERLAALKRKWVAAGDRVSEWKKPDLAERVCEICNFQRWCNDDKKARYPRFETACRDAVATKTDPVLWYYNLACLEAFTGQREPAIVDLEKAVAAGYGDAEWAKRDQDLVSLTGDVRFVALCGAMQAHGARGQEGSVDSLGIDGNPFPRLTGDNVRYDFEDRYYEAFVDTTNEDAIIYVNRHVQHPEIPAEGLVCPIYEEEARRCGRNVGPMDILFGGVPAIGASDYRFGENVIGDSASIPAILGVDQNMAASGGMALIANSIGVYPAGPDYGADGIDRFVGYFPWCVAHEGGVEESDKFVRLLADIVRPMDNKVSDGVMYGALQILRRAQKCVKAESDLLKGVSQRPVLRYEDIDATRAVELANSGDAGPLSPIFVRDDTGLDFVPTPAADLFESPWDRPAISFSIVNAAFVAHWAEYTARLKARVACIDKNGGRVEWRVLQGDPEKIRILPQNESNTVVKIEVDYHEAFDAELPGGRKIRTSRVDIGCFAIRNGMVSVPSILSVYFNPNGRRTYDENRRLASIDYARRQIRDFSPYLCAKGDWRDVFAYDGDGNMTGWTRYLEAGKGAVTTNRFTREGLVVDTVDRLGRPKDVHRSLRSQWMQSVCASNLVAGSGVNVGWLGYCGECYERQEGDPLEMTLAWKYEYADDADRSGKPSPKDPSPFRYRPELCLRAEFSEASGFRFPLVDQMMAGYWRHVAYRHDMPAEDVGGFGREDSAAALKAEKLNPPKTLKRMRFCPWTPSSNDVWTCDIRSGEKWCEALEIELADGAYRVRRQGDGFLSVAGSYCSINDYLSECAFEQLDARYPRCDGSEVKRVLPDVAQKSRISMWRISDRLVLAVFADDGLPLGTRGYEFIDTSGSEVAGGRRSAFAGTRNRFLELPSPAIGNTMLAAFNGDPEALNNFAVLFYCGVLNPADYEEESVIVVLERSARAGCATAKYNLGVLYENRGEKREAERYYEEARAMGFREM